MEDAQRILSPSSSSSSSLDLHPLPIYSELWLMAEERIQEILCAIQPVLASEQKRKEVIDYIQMLIRGYCDAEVFPFGSVPLKTYLPDGDIDLTAVSPKNMEEELARDVCCILKAQEQDPESQVKDVQYIQAQVKIVKCSVKNISIDISFNQVAGLGALCFLEQVDQLIGKDHLFKRSVILIKSWCFYESRILGAHHGLISTYALEVLVLYIINLFHSSLPGPLAVLHRFLEYYSTFDWDNYCVSITGPIVTSSLPEIVAKLPENNGHELLMRQEFLRNCKELFSISINSFELECHEFPIKHLNIMDPLKGSNNLGRSVNKGNFHRIRCALAYGAQRLGEVLTLPGESMGSGLEKFFSNTLDRNGRGERPDAQVPVPAFGTGRSEVSELSGDYDNYYNGLLQAQWYHDYTLPIPPHYSPPLSPSQIHLGAARDSLAQLRQCQTSIASRRGTDVFAPRVSFCQSYPSQLNAATSGNKVGKSRGTGTYIPNMTHNPYKDLLSWMKTRNPNSRSLNPFLKLHRKTDQGQNCDQTDNSRDGSCLDPSPDKFTLRNNWNGNCLNLSVDQFPYLPCNKKSDLSLDQFSIETKKCANDSCLDLSPDQFPSLPCIKKSRSLEMYESHLPVLNSPQGEDGSACLKGIEFGTFGCFPPVGRCSSKKQADARVSTTLEMIKDVQNFDMQEQLEMLKSNEKMGQRKHFQLKNDDFPPLCQ